MLNSTNEQAVTVEEEPKSPLFPLMASKPIPPLILAQINHLLSHPSLDFKVDNLASGCKNGVYDDRFSLLVPFCLEHVKWDVIYNALHPLVAPDVVFAEEDEGFDPLAMAEGEGESARSKGSGLFEWDAWDPSRLLKLILELRELYTVYQRKRVMEIDDERLKFEIDTALSREGIEVLVSVNDRVEEVKFAVPLLLDMDLNHLVPGGGCKQQKINLQVIFPVKKYSSIPTAPWVKLFASSGLKSFFSIDDVKLPPWVDGMCMAEYVPAVEENIKMILRESVAAIDGRRRFIEALAQFFGRPVEADPVFCRKATVYSCSGNFCFLVHFSLPTQFPKQKPTLTLQSCMHSNQQGTPIMSTPVKDYPWSPRWDAHQMAERIFMFLADECLVFKRFCMDSTSTVVM